jgi:hydrogenase maturation protease
MDVRQEIKEKINGKRLAVVGLGNIDRGDDGYGIMVAKLLKRKFPRRVYMETEGMAGVIKNINGREDIKFVLFVDAIEGYNRVGTINIIKSENIEDVKSSHKVPLKLYTALLDKPSAIIGIQPENLDFMQPISHSVKKGIKETVNLLTSQIENNIKRKKVQDE